MFKSIATGLVAATLLFTCVSNTNAQDNQASGSDTKATTQQSSDKAGDTKSDDTTADKGDKPAASPGWIVIEETWWDPFWFDFSDSLHQARVHYRARQEKAAAAEIEKSIQWLKYAENHADKKTASDLSIARADLMDFASRIRRGGQVKASTLDVAFSHASKALSKHHHFKASKALAKDDLKTAGRHLMAAADHLRDAARSANYEYGSDVAEIYDYYSPFGYWDETVVLDKNKLEANLESVENELVKLGKKLGAKKQ